MAKDKSGSRAGGGPGSRVIGKPTQYFVGRPSERINPRGVGQIGQSQGNHATASGKKLGKAIEPVRGPAVGGMGSVPLGNQTSLEAGQGPGAGREVMRCGSQQGVSPSTPIGPTRDTLAGK
jgi:hypothetical protein